MSIFKENRRYIHLSESNYKDSGIDIGSNYNGYSYSYLVCMDIVPNYYDTVSFYADLEDYVMFIDDGVVSEIHEVPNNLFLVNLMKNDDNFRLSGAYLFNWGVRHSHIGLIKSCMHRDIKLTNTSKSMLVDSLISNGTIETFELLLELGFNFSRSIYYSSLRSKCLSGIISPRDIYDIGKGDEIKYIDVLSKKYDGINELHERIITFLDLNDVNPYCFPLCRVGDRVNDIVNGTQNSILVTSKSLKTIMQINKFIPKIRVNAKMNSVKSFEIVGDILYVHIKPTSRFGKLVRCNIERGVDGVCLIGDYGFDGDELKVYNINARFDIPKFHYVGD